MMERKNRQWKNAMVLLFMLLALSLPAMAVPQIVSVSGKGLDNIQGIIRATDAITFEAVVSNDSGQVNPANVRLGSSIYFTSCAPLTLGRYFCTVRDPASGTDSFMPDEALPFEVNFFPATDTPGLVLGGTLLVDSRIPTVGFSSVSPQIAAQENVTFAYSIADEACGSEECQGKCSGIKSVEFFYFQKSAKQVVQTKDISSSACSFSSTVSFPSSAFPEGPNALYLQAKDGVDLVSAVNSVPFTVDNVGPGIQDGTFSLTLKGRELAHYRTGNTTAAIIKIQIRDAQLNPASVVADFSALNPSDAALKQSIPSCQMVSSGVWNCTWNVNMRLSSSGPKQFYVNASDVEGNAAVSNLVRSFSPDDTGPAISNFDAGNGQFAYPVSVITGTLVEEGVGVLASEMVLRVGNQNIPAKSCDALTCTWEQVNLGVGNVTVALGNSKDILGNPSQAYSEGFTVTLTPPGIGNVTIVGVGGRTNSVVNFIATGDRLAISADVVESTDIASATADVSAFIPGMAAVEGQCERKSEKSLACVWLTEPVQNAVSGTIRLSLRNSAGIVMNKTAPLRTYSSDNNATPDYWTSTVSCTPSVLDRLLGPLINQKSYCTVRLVPNINVSKKKLQTVSMDLAACTGDKTSLLQSAEIFNRQSASTTPLLKLTLAKNDLKIDEIRTTCTINIISKVESAITRAPEEEQVFITLQFFNNPLGTIDDAAQKKLDEALKSTTGLGGFIGTLQTALHYAQNICKLFSTYLNIVNGMFAIAQVIGVKAETVCTSSTVLPFLGVACAPLKTSATGTCLGEQTQQDLIAAGWQAGGNKLCKMASCEWVPEALNWAGDATTEIFNKAPGLQGEFNAGTEVGAQAIITQLKNDAESGKIKVGDDYAKSTNEEKKTLKTGSDYAKVGEKARPILGIEARDLSGFPISVKSSLTTSVLFGCVPGIIENVDKYRQISCLYADCIQTAVMEDNVPLKVCEDLKAEATCKYVTGEIFAIIPYTALFDNVVNYIKNELSNPLTAVGLGAYAYCKFACPVQGAPGAQASYTACNGFRIASKIGLMVKEITGIVQQGFFPPKTADYCKIVSERAEGGENKGLFGGLFGGSSKS